MSASISTSAIFGLRALERGTTADYANWATCMLEEGHDSRNLRILAGLDSFTSTVEAKDYFSKAVTELAIVEPSREAAIRGYAAFLVERMLDKTLSQKMAVKMLSNLCYSSNYPEYLMRWYNLEDALSDVINGYEPWSRRGLTRENAGTIIDQDARVFLQEMADYRPDPSTGSG